MSKIEWTDETWNPVTGCTKVSEGCRHCYAERITKRFGGDFAKVECHENRLEKPLKWRKPRMVFVNSMSDLFHEAVPDAFIDKVFSVMALCPQHVFQVLTKRPERMRGYLADNGYAIAKGVRFTGPLKDRLESTINQIRHEHGFPFDDDRPVGQSVFSIWPFKNVWLGVSVEDQQTADERIPMLLDCPAAVRFLSCEPLLAAIPNLILCHRKCGSVEPVPELKSLINAASYGPASSRSFTGDVCGDGEYLGNNLWGRNMEFHSMYCPKCGYLMEGPEIQWVIVGGESGPKARPCAGEWIRQIISQCKFARVPVFVKQLGSWLATKDPKGGDPSEWPEDLRVREWPTCTAFEPKEQDDE